MIAWGFNPGQWAVKNTFQGKDGRLVELRPFPAVIAPEGRGDDLGLGGARSKTLGATVDGVRYLVGHAAERHPLANRQMADGRLDADSPLYRALVQASAAAAQSDRRVGAVEAPLVVATALPVGWRSEEADAALERHVRAGLKPLSIKALYVRSEPAAVVYHELLDDAGAIQQQQAPLAKALVCVGDIGGSTLNRAVLSDLEVIAGSAASPLLGSRQAIEQLADARGIQFVDAERQLIAAAQNPGQDAPADAVLRQYRDAVIAELQRAWASYKGARYLFAGGTVQWFGSALLGRAFPGARVVDRPQQAIATGLARYARRQIARLAKEG
jgi:hypothetical protein